MASSPKQPRNLPVPLIAFWSIVAVISLGGIGVLQFLGPPEPPPLPLSAIQHGAAFLPQPSVIAPAISNTNTGHVLPGSPIAALDPALLTAAGSNPDLLVPRIGPDGLTPMRAYAAAAVVPAGAHVAVLVAGLGDDDAQSQAAITTLPAAVSLALTPYGQHTAEISALARASGHEIILELPMQGLNPAKENAGDEALMVASPITLNQPILDWNLSQIQGYAGVTDAIGASQGAGFMGNGNAKAWLLQEVADMGLFFIDARQTGSAPYAWNRTADVLIDPVTAPQAEAAQLDRLTALAKMQGSAMGILMNPAPNSVQLLQSWALSLTGQGVTLVPVSAIVLPPAAQASALPAAAVATPTVNP